MKFRKELLKHSTTDTGNDDLILKTVTEAAEKTLCPKQEGRHFHNIECLERECNVCGVDALYLLPEEMANEGSVRWSRYESQQESFLRMVKKNRR